MALTVFLLDGHAVFRRALRDYLAGVGGVEVVGEAAGGKEAEEQVARLHPDLVLMEVQLPGEEEGMRVCAVLKRRHPALRVLLYSMFDLREGRGRTMGAEGVLRKDKLFEELLPLLRGPA